MAIPSGSGTEVLCRGSAHALSNSATALKFDGTANSTVGTNTATVPSLNIITLLSISFTDASASADTINLIINDGSNDIYLLKAQTVPSNGTFVFSEKMVIGAGDKVTVFTDATANIDIWYSYIKQDWTQEKP